MKKKEIDTLLALRMKLVKEGWDHIQRPAYPRPYLWDYLKIEHPEILEEFKEWFDDNVRWE